MKYLVFFLVTSVILAAGISGCGLEERIIAGSGNIVTQEEDFTDFNRVEASHSFKLDIQQGDSYVVTIRIDDNLLDNLEVTNQNNTLKIGLVRNIVVSNATMEADITMPELVDIGLSGASEADINTFVIDEDFRAGLSGSSFLSGNLEAQDARFNLSGSSDVRLEGSGNGLDIDASGSSNLELAEFVVEDATVSLSGSSEATVNVNGSLNVNASGASNVYYLGNPSMGNIDTSGASSVEPR